MLRAEFVNLFRLKLEPLDDRLVPSGFRQTNLVADDPGVAALTDSGLTNAWGISLNQAGGAFWLSANGAGTSPLYTGDVNGSVFAKAPFTVSIPGGAPTGQVFNTTPDFLITNGSQTAKALFIFAGETGSITGWNPAVPPLTQARVGVTVPGARYTGLALGTVETSNFLYAADFKNGRIDVFNGSFQKVTPAGDFVDPGLHRLYKPFNIQNLDGKLYVTYAKANGGGNGFVSVFDLEGNFLMRLASGGHLQEPWGLALAPEGFGDFGGAVLVGNHKDGSINAFAPSDGDFLGKLRDEAGEPIRIDGLFGLAFGNGVSAGDEEALYFAAGPNGGADGLFGSLRFVDDAAGASVAVHGLFADDGEDEEVIVLPEVVTADEELDGSLFAGVPV